MVYPQGQMCKSTWTGNRLIHHVVHRAFSQTQSFRGVHSIFRWLQSSILLLQTAVENKATVIRLQNHCTHTLQPLDTCFFGPLKRYSKAKPQLVKSLDIAWRLLGFAWSKVASVGVPVSAFESTGVYPFDRNRVPKYVFSISDTSENITSMEIALPNNGSGLCILCFRKQLSKCATYLSRTFIKYCGYYTSFWHFSWRNYFLQAFENQSSTEIPRKPSIEKIATPFLIVEEANNIEEKRKMNEQRNRKCQQPQYLRARRSENAEKEVQKTDIHNLETTEDSGTKCCEYCESSLQTTKEDDRIECVSCRNWLHVFCSPYKHRYFDCGR